MPDQKDDFSGSYLRFGGVGFEFAGAVAVGCTVGYFIDRHWHSKPYGVLIGTLFGIAIGFYLVVKSALMMNKDEEERRKGRSGKDEN